MGHVSSALLDRLARRLGRKGFTTDAGDMAPWLSDWRGRYHGRSAALLSPASREEVVEIVRLCAAEKVPLVPQGGNTSMVGGATPDGSGDSLLLSLRRMKRIRAIEPAANLAVCEAGVILADLHDSAATAGSSHCRRPSTVAKSGYREAGA